MKHKIFYVIITITLLICGCQSTKNSEEQETTISYKNSENEKNETFEYEDTITLSEGDYEVSSDQFSSYNTKETTTYNENIQNDNIDIMSIFEENFNNNFSDQFSEFNIENDNGLVPAEEYNTIKMSTTSDVITEGHYAYIRCYGRIYRFDDRTKTFTYVMDLDKSNLANWLVAENWIYYVTTTGTLKRISVDGTKQEIIEERTMESETTTFCFNNGLHYIKEYYDFVSGNREYWLIKLNENMEKVKLALIGSNLDTMGVGNIYHIDLNGTITLEFLFQLYKYNPTDNSLDSVIGNSSMINNYYFEDFNEFKTFKNHLELYCDLNQFFECDKGIIISNHYTEPFSDLGVFLYTPNDYDSYYESQIFREIEVEGVTKGGYIFMSYGYIYDINTQTAYEYAFENNTLSIVEP